VLTDNLAEVKKFGFVTTAETDLEAFERVCRSKNLNYSVQKSYQGHWVLSLV